MQNVTPSTRGIFLPGHGVSPQLTVFRRLPFYGFLATIPPMMWFYYRHSVLRIPGGMSSHRIFKTKLIRGKLSLHLLLNV